MAQNPSMAPSADEVMYCKVLPGLPIVLDTPGLVDEIEQADHLFARFANTNLPTARMSGVGRDMKDAA